MGSYRNIKITTKEDLVIAEAFLKEGSLKENKKEQTAPAEKGNSVKKESQERKAESRQAKQVKEAVHQQERRVQIHLQVQVMSYLNA